MITLNPTQQEEIFRLRNEVSQRKLAERYGVSRHAIVRIHKGKYNTETAKDDVHTIHLPSPIDSVIDTEVEVVPGFTVAASWWFKTDYWRSKDTYPTIPAKSDGTPVSAESLVVTLTAKQAKQVLENTNYELNRPIKQTRIFNYQYQMQQGKFTITTLSFVRRKNQLTLVDGQHRLEAQVAAGTNQEYNILVSPINSEEDLSLVYERIDIGAQRTFTDSLRTDRAIADAGITTNQSAKLSSAVAIISYGFRQARGANRLEDNYLLQSRTFRRKVSVSFVEEAVLFFACLTGTNSRLNRTMTRSSLMSIALTTLRYQPTKAAEFWQAISENDRLPAKSPAARVVAFLLNNPESDSIAMNTRLFARAWNAYFENTPTIAGMHSAPTDKPILLKGTPYDGKHDWRINEEGKLFESLAVAPGPKPKQKESE